jgi:hypothetical protein
MEFCSLYEIVIYSDFFNLETDDCVPQNVGYLLKRQANCGPVKKNSAPLRSLKLSHP